MMPMRPDTHIHDYMSYGGGSNWTALDTWAHMFEAMRRNESTGDGREGTASGEPIDDPGEERVVVTGVVLPDGSIQLGLPYFGLPPTGEAGAGPIVEVRDAAGVVVATGETFLLGGATHDDSGTEAFVSVLPPGLHGAVLVVIGEGGEETTIPTEEVGIEFGEVTVSYREEEPSGDAPCPGDRDTEEGAVPSDSIATVCRTLAVSWDGAVGPSYLVEASLDGHAWWQIGESPEPSVELDFSLVPFEGPDWVIRVQATDGVNVHTIVSGPVDLGSQAPLALIGDPLGGDRASPQMYRATAVRTSMGGDDPHYEWTLNGEPVGEGPETFLPLLLPGLHTVGLTVSNEAGSDHTEVTVEVIVDEDRDRMDDAWELANGLDPTDPSDGALDPDGDGLPTAWEHTLRTDPNSIDSDGDDYADAIELAGGGDPLDPGSLPGYLHGAPGGSPPPRITALEAALPTGFDLSSIPAWAWVTAGLGLGAGLGTLGRARRRMRT